MKRIKSVLELARAVDQNVTSGTGQGRIRKYDKFFKENGPYIFIEPTKSPGIVRLVSACESMVWNIPERLIDRIVK